MRQDKKLAISAIVAIVIVMVGVYYAINMPREDANAEYITLGQISNMIKTTTNVKAGVIQDKVNNISGVALTEVAKSTNSGVLERTGETSRDVFKRGQAELALYRETGPDGNEYVSATITNTGTSKFYLLSLGFAGYTKGGISTLTAYGINAGYSSDVWVDYPEPPITKAVILNPGESITTYIIGKWSLDEVKEPITDFSAGALYAYDVQGITTNQPTQHWSIRVPDDSSP